MGSATLTVAPGVLTAANAGARSSAPARTNAFARFVDRIVEGRLRKAEAEIQLYHRHLLPDDFDRKLGSLPFVR
jgi:hypothetical protein